MRPDHLGCYGYTKAQTPAIDSLAENGLRFENAYANSSFLGQSLSALLTGLLPTNGGTIDLLGAYPHDSTPTLASRFLADGRATALFTNQSLLQRRGFTNGYEDVAVRGGKSAASATDIVEDALLFVEDVAGDPFFLHVHFSEPHEPYGDAQGGHSVRGVRERYAEYNADEALREGAMAALAARYDAEVTAVDAALQQLLDGLNERGAGESCTIVFTATHGEEFWEHGYVGHAWTLHEEVIRVPLILHAPGRAPAQSVGDTVSLVDLYPTLLNAFQVTTPEGRLDGRSLLQTSGEGLLFSPPESVIAELVLRDRCVVRAVIRDGYKYVAEQYAPAPADRVRLEGPPLPVWMTPARERLYNLNGDSAELEEIAAAEESSVASHRAILKVYQAQCEASGLPPHELADAMEIGDTDDPESLETLGYL